MSASAARQTSSSKLACPNCSSEMHQHRIASVDHRQLELDVCYQCNGIWFDDSESSRLSPDGVVDLFRLIHERGGTRASALGTHLSCVRCKSSLFEVKDIARNNRFTYHRCQRGHGRFTTFLQFLREKQFVRDLTATERSKLAAQVKQVKCSSCGGPVDLAHDPACRYCGASVSVLDRDAAQKAINHYLQERGKYPRRPASTPSVNRRTNPNYGNDYATTTSPELGFYLLDAGVDAVTALARLAAVRSAAAAPTVLPSAAVLASDADIGGALGSVLADSGTSSLAGGADLLSTGLSSANGTLSDIGSGALDSAGDVVSSMTDGVGDVAGSSFEGLTDFVSDGIGAIVSSIFS